jgi:hypothetical protein
MKYLDRAMPIRNQNVWAMPMRRFKLDDWLFLGALAWMMTLVTGALVLFVFFAR